jgi:nucleoside-diphosphate-sugar epimerase
MAKLALVTGACGFSGGYMVDLLKQEGWNVIATDLKRDEHKEQYCEEGGLHPVYHEEAIDKKGVKFIPANLTDKESLKPLFEYDYDVIFHTASLYDYFALWDILYKVNVEGLENLLDVAMKKGVKRFIHWSTCGVYAEPRGEAITEDHPFDPPNNYCKSKAEQEKILWKLYKEKGFPVTIIRCGPIYGLGQRYGVMHVFHILEKLGVVVNMIWYPKKYTLMYPSVHVTDLVRGALFVAEREECIGESYNVLSDCITQVELMTFLAKSLGLREIRIPIWWPVYLIFCRISVAIARKQDRQARKIGARPKQDLPMVEYIAHNHWFSNQKIKDLGFKFKYQDPRSGIFRYIGECRERGWL